MDQLNLNENTMTTIMTISLIFINLAVWFIAGILYVRRTNKGYPGNTGLMKKDEVRKLFQNPGQPAPTAEERFIRDAMAPGRKANNDIYERNMNFWWDTAIKPIPVNKLIDIIDSAGRTHHKVKLVRRDPIKFEPEFLRYKNVISWRFHEPNA